MAMRALAFAIAAVALGGCIQDNGTLDPSGQVGWKQKRQGLDVQSAVQPSGSVRKPTADTSSNITARKRPAPSSSIATTNSSTTCCQTARRFATASQSAKRPKPGAASPRSAAWKNGRPGFRPPASRRGSAPYRPMSPAARTTRWARAACTCIPDNKDTLYRIHGTNQPEYIGSAVSSGCIRMTNEDAIDLYNRVKVGTWSSFWGRTRTMGRSARAWRYGAGVEQPTELQAFKRRQQRGAETVGAIFFCIASSKRRVRRARFPAARRDEPE